MGNSSLVFIFDLGEIIAMDQPLTAATLSSLIREAKHLAIRIGFAGCGYIAGVHMSNLKRDQRVEITCTYDPDPARTGTIGVNDFDELLSRVDAVYVTAPNTLHAELAQRALAAGKHVFCEKPMATTLDAAHQVLDAARAAETVFQVGFNRRFAPVYRRVKELLESAPPHCAHVKMNRGELLQPVWTGDDQITGGFLFEPRFTCST